MKPKIDSVNNQYAYKPFRNSLVNNEDGNKMRAISNSNELNDSARGKMSGFILNPGKLRDGNEQQDKTGIEESKSEESDMDDSKSENTCKIMAF
jgi:hypothetical protein